MAKNSLRKFERELGAEDWRQVHEGVEVRITPAPNGEAVFILCRSAERRAKEQAMPERFEKRIGLRKGWRRFAPVVRRRNTSR